jgi:hypothetical protein
MMRNAFVVYKKKSIYTVLNAFTKTNDTIFDGRVKFYQYRGESGTDWVG